MQNKNVLQNTSPSRTFGNLTAVVQEDGTVILNGTSSVTAFIDINANTFVESGMILSGCPSGGSNNTYCLRVTKLSDNIRINANYTCDNLIFRPMIRYPNTDGVFVAYEEPVIKNIYVDSPLDEDEYVDFREQKRFNSDDTREIVSLPAVTCIDGTNVLSVNTGIQPASVYLQGSIEEIQATPLQTLNLNSRNSEIMNFDDVSLDVMPIEKPVNLNEVGGGKSAE